ncbi:MAG: hypothetical protein WAZ27_03150 [Minisyncoccia bacterium]
MQERPLFMTQAAVVTAVGAVHIVALHLYLYWYFPWLDLLVHFSGGLWVALVSAWLLLMTRREPTLFVLIACVIAIGIAWEVFEYTIGMSRGSTFVMDTSLDILMDLLGGIAGVILARRMRTHATISTHEANQSHTS